MNNELPEDPKDAIGCIIRIKDDSPHHTIKNFGWDKYLLKFTEDPILLERLSDNDKIRLFPLDKEGKPLDQVHILATIMGYKKLREKFIIVSKPLK